MFPPAGAGRELADQRIGFCAAHRGSAVILMPSAAPAAAEEAAETICTICGRQGARLGNAQAAPAQAHF
jgi:hypothetical protein